MNKNKQGGGAPSDSQSREESCCTYLVTAGNMPQDMLDHDHADAIEDAFIAAYEAWVLAQDTAGAGQDIVRGMTQAELKRVRTAPRQGE